MKFTQVTLAAALLATVSAQGLDSLPDCSKTCATSALPANCGLNIQCICADKSFLSSIACCVADKCSPADQETTIQVAKGICSRGGVTDLPSTVSCSTSGSSSATGTSSGTMTGSTSGTMTSNSETTLTGSATATKTEASATNSAASSASSASKSASSAASSASSATSAAATTGAAVLGQTRDSALMAAAGAAAAFAVLI